MSTAVSLVLREQIRHDSTTSTKTLSLNLFLPVEEKSC